MDEIGVRSWRIYNACVEKLTGARRRHRARRLGSHTSRSRAPVEGIGTSFALFASDDATLLPLRERQNLVPWAIVVWQVPGLERRPESTRTATAWFRMRGDRNVIASTVFA
jgi:hypothetical protein